MHPDFVNGDIYGFIRSWIVNQVEGQRARGCGARGAATAAAGYKRYCYQNNGA